MDAGHYNPPEIKISPHIHQLLVNTARAMQDLGQQMPKVAACGIDCTHYEALRQHLRTTAENIIQEFGPKNPTIH